MTELEDDLDNPPDYETRVGQVADTVAAYFGSTASGPHERDSNIWELAEQVLAALGTTEDG